MFLFFVLFVFIIIIIIFFFQNKNKIKNKTKCEEDRSFQRFFNLGESRLFALTNNILVEASIFLFKIIVENPRSKNDWRGKLYGELTRYVRRI